MHAEFNLEALADLSVGILVARDCDVIFINSAVTRISGLKKSDFQQTVWKKLISTIGDRCQSEHFPVTVCGEKCECVIFMTKLAPPSSRDEDWIDYFNNRLSVIRVCAQLSLDSSKDVSVQNMMKMIMAEVDNLDCNASSSSNL